MRRSRYWYHEGSDTYFEDSDPDSETALSCDELTYEEYIKRRNNKTMATKTLAELENEYKALERRAREVSTQIGQHETLIDTAMEGLAKAFPDKEFGDPKDIDFDGLLKEVQAQIDEETASLDAEFKMIEEKVNGANDELQHLVRTA